MKIHQSLLNSDIFELDESLNIIKIKDIDNKIHIFKFKKPSEYSTFYNIVLGNNKKIILDTNSKILTLNNELNKEFLSCSMLNFKTEILTDRLTGYTHVFKDKTYLSTRYINFFYKNIFLKYDNLNYIDIVFFTKELFEQNKFNVKRFNNKRYNILKENWSKYNHLTLERKAEMEYNDYIEVEVNCLMDELVVIINGFIVKLV